MKEKIKTILRSKRGMSNLIPFLFGLIGVLAILFISLGIFRAGNEYVTLNDFATELVKTAGDVGKTSDEKIQHRYDELSSASGLKPKAEFSADYWDKTQTTVQYGDTITLLMSCDTTFLTIGSYNLPLHLTIKKTAKSQEYWK